MSGYVACLEGTQHRFDYGAAEETVFNFSLQYIAQ
jgi:hypothetical protein